MHPFDQMTQDQLKAYTNNLAREIQASLPAGTFFFLIFGPFDGEGSNETQYVGNAVREGAIKTLRETADRLERRETSERSQHDRRPNPENN